ncbi:hypothetical protein F4810DRAFT_665954 [Camillea tinctor]|nr:hypothetical protein F4810DRAFT_665954 [Camillea tinctor]
MRHIHATRLFAHRKALHFLILALSSHVPAPELPRGISLFSELYNAPNLPWKARGNSRNDFNTSTQGLTICVRHITGGIRK